MVALSQKCFGPSGLGFQILQILYSYSQSKDPAKICVYWGNPERKPPALRTHKPRAQTQTSSSFAVNSPLGSFLTTD